MCSSRELSLQRARDFPAGGIVGPRTMAKSFEEEQLPISIQGHFLDQLILIGVAVVNGAADGESVGRPALRLVSPAALGIAAWKCQRNCLPRSALASNRFAPIHTQPKSHNHPAVALERLGGLES
jgi:hypothetical protein